MLSPETPQTSFQKWNLGAIQPVSLFPHNFNMDHYVHLVKFIEHLACDGCRVNVVDGLSGDRLKVGVGRGIQ